MVDVPKILISEITTDPAPNLANIVLPQRRDGNTWKIGGEKLAELVLDSAYVATAKLKGAVGNGAAIENTAFGNLYASNSEIFIDAGTYKFSSQVDLAAKDVRITIHPDAVFTDFAWNMQDLLTAIGPAPSFAFNTFYKDVTSYYDLWAHVVGTSVVTKLSTDGVTAVSIFANCEVAAAGSHGFGLNVGAYVTGAGTGIVAEFDSHVTHPDGLGYAVVIDSVGSYASQAAIVIQPNGPNSPFLTGISFNNASGNDAITNNAIQFLNAGSAEKFLFSHADMMFTSAVMDTNVFVIGPSASGATGALRVDASTVAAPKLSAWGAATDIGILHQTKGIGAYQFLAGDGLNRLFIAGNPGTTYAKFTAGNAGFTLEAAGTDTNADVVIKGKGNAGGKLQNGNGLISMEWGNTGIGFYGAAETAKQTITGSRGGNAAVASMATALAAVGLFIDSTTA